MLINNTLRPNPFHTYRDPETGRWITFFSATSRSHQPPFQTEKTTSSSTHFKRQESEVKKTQAAS
jgi:hypothetical protein